MNRHQQNQFNFFIPASFEKGKKKGKDVIRVKGVASTSTATDSDGEVLFPDGFDYTPLLQKGFLNWDHQTKGRPSAVIGEPDVAKVVNNGKDFYIEGFLYDSKEAQEVAELAEVLERNSPNRRLGYSIEGQVIERGSNDKNHPAYKQVLKARITGVAITPCPKNPNTLLSLMKGEYADAYVDDINDEELEEIIDTVEKGGKGSGRKIGFGKEGPSGTNPYSKGDSVTYHRQFQFGKEGSETAKVVANHPNGHVMLDNGHSLHHIELQHAENKLIEKAMTAEGASEAGMLPESVEGTKNPNKYPLDTDKEHAVGRLLKKSEVYNLIAETYTTDIVKAKRIYSLIETVNTKMFDMKSTEITMDAVNEAFAFLNKAAEQGDIQKSDDNDADDKVKEKEGKDEEVEKSVGVNTDIEKAKEMCKGLLEKGVSPGGAVDEMTKSGFSLDTAASACTSCVSEMSNLKENGGTITTANAENGNTGDDQPLKKGEVSELIAESIKPFNETNDLIKGLSDIVGTKFDAVGKILKASFEQNDIMKAQLDELQKTNNELNARLGKVEKDPVPAKSITKVGAVERFAKSESAVAEGADVYNIKTKEGRNDLCDRINGEIEKSRSNGRTPSQMLENAVSELDIVGGFSPSTSKAVVPMLKAIGITVVSE